MSTYVYGVMVDMWHFIMGANFIITFVLLWKYLESLSKWRASQAIQKLLQLQEKEAIRLVDGKEEKVAVDDLALWDIVVVRAWDKIPVDGGIVSGTTDIDESMLTGESIPVSKKEGDDVYTWTVVINGHLHIEVTKTSDQTMLAKIIEVVNDAQANKPPIQKKVDTISSYFVWWILVVATITLFVWYATTWDWSQSILYTISVIVIACPCAMWLATPIAIMVASWTWASQWILIKSWEMLEKSQKVDVVVFDKTWTLTQWAPQVTDVVSYMSNQEQMLRFAGALSGMSHHPLSQSVVEHVWSKVEQLTVAWFEEISGHGLVGQVQEQSVLVWNKKLLASRWITIEQEVYATVGRLQEEGKTVNFVVLWENIAWLIALQDAPKADAKQAVEWLQQLGIEVWMMSGDTEKTVQAIAKEIGVDQWIGEVLPDQKAQQVKQIQDQWKFVAFVWDGINDAPALAQSDLWVGIGQWSDIAIEAADIVLVQWNPSKVLDSIVLSRKTYRIIMQNLFWAFAYNTILIPVAALWFLVPMYASLAMSLSSVSVVVNSLRIKRVWK